MPYKLEKFTEPLVLGEAPHWDDRVEALYFVDIESGTIHRYEPSTQVHTKTKLNGRVGFIIPLEGATDQFVVGLEKKFLIIHWDGKDGSPAHVRDVFPDVATNRLNDGKCDPKGRLFAGSLGGEKPPGQFTIPSGSLYRLEGTKPTTVADKILLSNGLAWDVDRKAFYYIDSMEYNIRRYDYDVKTGNISNMKYIFDFKKNNQEGFPDGLTIDTDGNLWVCCFNGSCVLKIDPTTGKLLEKITIPAKQVTSATFGGPNMDILFVTTASLNIDGVQKPPCGSTYMVTGLGVKGHRNVNFIL